MPLMTIHVDSAKQKKSLAPQLEELRKLAAEKLTCGSKALNPDEISIRVVESKLQKKIADIEIIIIAYAYPERVEHQDQICNSFKNFIEQKCPPHTTHIWLQLSEFGHSA